MKKPAPENERFFMRFHKNIYNMIEEYAQSQNIKKATAVARILEDFAAFPYPLSPRSCCYFLKRGRSFEKVISKGMRITMKRIMINTIQIMADEENVKENDYISAIIFTFLEREKGR